MIGNHDYLSQFITWSNERMGCNAGRGITSHERVDDYRDAVELEVSPVSCTAVHIRMMTFLPFKDFD